MLPNPQALFPNLVWRAWRALNQIGKREQIIFCLLPRAIFSSFFQDFSWGPGPEFPTKPKANQPQTMETP